MLFFHHPLQRSRDAASALRNRFFPRHKAGPQSAPQAMVGKTHAEPPPSLRSTAQRTPPASFRRPLADILAQAHTDGVCRRSFELPAHHNKPLPALPPVHGKRTSDGRGSWSSHTSGPRKRRMSSAVPARAIEVPSRSTSLEASRSVQDLRASCPPSVPPMPAVPVAPQEALGPGPRPSSALLMWQQLMNDDVPPADDSDSEASLGHVLMSETDAGSDGDNVPSTHDQDSVRCLRRIVELQCLELPPSTKTRRQALLQLRRLDPEAQYALVTLYEELLSPSTVDVARLSRSLQNKSIRQVRDLVAFLVDLGQGATDASALPGIADKWLCFSSRERRLLEPVVLTAAAQRDRDDGTLQLIEQGLARVLRVPPSKRLKLCQALTALPRGRDLLPIKPLIDAWLELNQAGRAWQDCVGLADWISPPTYGALELSDMVRWVADLRPEHRYRLTACAEAIREVIEFASGRPIERRHFHAWGGVLEGISMLPHDSLLDVVELLADTLDVPDCIGKLDKCLWIAATSLRVL